MTINWISVSYLFIVNAHYKCHSSQLRYFATLPSTYDPCSFKRLPILKCVIFCFLSSMIFLVWIASSRKPFLEPVFSSSFGTPAFSREICMEFFFTLLAKSDGTPAIVGTAKLSTVGISDSSASLRTLHGHANTSASAVDLVVIGFVTLNDIIFSFVFTYSFLCDGKSEIMATFDSMGLSGCYA